MWIFMAVLSAFFAGITSILAKCGIKKTDSDVATALRTIVVLVFSWIMVFVTGAAGGIRDVTLEQFLFLILSGFATGASWICYFKALSMGNVNKVVPVDKSSTILSVLIAMVLFQETGHLVFRLFCTTLLAAGILLMVEKRREVEENTDGRWMVYAVLSAVFAALTSILAKVGMTGIDSNLGTAIRTGIVLIMAWVIVLMKGKQKSVRTVDKKELLFLFLSGIATGASWLCYYYAIQNGIVSVVVPIDKLSIVVTVVFSGIVLKEKIGKKALAGLLLMVAGTIGMALA